MENELVKGILEIFEDKLRELGIQLPAVGCEAEPETPIIGYHYADLYDTISDFLYDRLDPTHRKLVEVMQNMVCNDAFDDYSSLERYDKIIMYGKVDGQLHVLWEHNNTELYYSYCIFDSLPENMEYASVCQFLRENETEGTSIAGTYKVVTEEMSASINRLRGSAQTIEFYVPEQPKFVYEPVTDEINALGKHDRDRSI